MARGSFSIASLIEPDPTPDKDTVESDQTPTKDTIEPNLLLRLPGELRNRIYRDLIEHDRTHESLCLSERWFGGIGGRWQYKVEPDTPALAFTCKQIRHEVLDIFFGERTFDLTFKAFQYDKEWLERWSRIAGPSLRYLRKVRGVLYFDGLPGTSKKSSSPHPYGVVDVTVSKTGSLALRNAHGTLFTSYNRETLDSLFEQRLQEAMAGLVGSPDDPPVVRFFKSFAKEVERKESGGKGRKRKVTMDRLWLY
ncbi:uncharacterized protein LTR77_007785 [Saxophila tyrrhenica]|uniref:F-box domain-containing protein n=1 Tax=Saxophila tyrrhenica TaxID=1690608 RepID=A0AAV9P3J8_9PEZI|nr:hypothetical protein LTR77_007785 [Saxophila tyrrhenica]